VPRQGLSNDGRAATARTRVSDTVGIRQMFRWSVCDDVEAIGLNPGWSARDLPPVEGVPTVRRLEEQPHREVRRNEPPSRLEIDSPSGRLAGRVWRDGYILLLAVPNPREGVSRAR
jgi:hypothetical protein